jgi:serine/threonine protein kinase
MNLLKTDTAAEPTPRYELIRPLAKGGLGEVFLARDVRLHRNIALKVIGKELRADAVMRRRLQVEAEMTGKLEHPAIVPIHSVEEDDDGCPFYTMRLIRGETLSRVVRRYHVETPNDNLQFRKLLGCFTMVCQAVAHAHRRGVIHRDIKPDNIMLGPHDETLLVDWGLAKLLPTEDTYGINDEIPNTASDTSSGDDPGQLLLESEQVETRIGHSMGTPGFMSPEQAMGLVDQANQASDIYSLGVTFYFLLTGQPAFEGSNAMEILEKSVVGSFPPPRDLDPSVDPALEAICLKAMALSPSGRYAAASQMADDINAYLADAPISAWHEPMWYRLRRQLRRYQSIALVGMGALLLITLVLASGFLLLTNSYRRERNARLMAQDQKVEAEENLRLAMRSVDQFLSRVADTPQDSNMIAPSLRRELLTEASEFFETFLERRPHDSPLTAEWGRLHMRMSQVGDAMGDMETALNGARQAIDIFQTQLAKSGSSAEAQDELTAELAAARDRLGALLLECGEEQAGQSQLQQSWQLYQQLIADHPQVPSLRTGPASILQNLAKLDFDAGNAEEAIAKCEQGIELLSTLDAANFDDETAAQHMRQHAGLIRNQAVMLQATRQLQKATAAYREAETLQRHLCDRYQLPTDKSALAETMADLGILFSSQEPPDPQASLQFETALKILRELVAQQPTSMEHQRRLAQTLNNYAGLLVDLDRPFDAIAALGESLVMQRGLAKSVPERRSHREHLLATLGNQAWLMACLGRADECRALCNEAKGVIDSFDEQAWNAARRQAAVDHLARIEELLTQASKVLVPDDE